MFKKLKHLYNPEYMRIPLLIKCGLKLALSIIICLVLINVVDTSLGIGSIFTAAAIFFLAFFLYRLLCMDASWAWDALMNAVGKRKKTPSEQRWNSDIMDYTGEEVANDDLEEDEEEVLKMLSNLIPGLLYLVLAVITSILGM